MCLVNNANVLNQILYLDKMFIFCVHTNISPPQKKKSFSSHPHADNIVCAISCTSYK